MKFGTGVRDKIEKKSRKRQLNQIRPKDSHMLFNVVNEFIRAVESVHKSSDSDSSIFKTPTPTPS
jgi:hypothetical protein